MRICGVYRSALRQPCGAQGTDQAFAIPVGHAHHVDVFDQALEGAVFESRVVVRFDRDERIQAFYPSFCSVDFL